MFARRSGAGRNQKNKVTKEGKEKKKTNWIHKQSARVSIYLDSFQTCLAVGNREWARKRGRKRKKKPGRGREGGIEPYLVTWGVVSPTAEQELYWTQTQNTQKHKHTSTEWELSPRTRSTGTRCAYCGRYWQPHFFRLPFCFCVSFIIVLFLAERGRGRKVRLFPSEHFAWASHNFLFCIVLFCFVIRPASSLNSLTSANWWGTEHPWLRCARW